MTETDARARLANIKRDHDACNHTRCDLGWLIEYIEMLSIGETVTDENIRKAIAEEIRDAVGGSFAPDDADIDPVVDRIMLILSTTLTKAQLTVIYAKRAAELKAELGGGELGKMLPRGIWNDVYRFLGRVSRGEVPV